MHWYTFKSLLNTLGSAVEQLPGCLDILIYMASEFEPD